MLGIDADTVLIKVSVRGELPEPGFAAEGERNGAERESSARSVPFVVTANDAFGVAAGDGIAALGFIGVAELRFGKVDGDDEPVVAVESGVLIQGGFLDVIVVDTVGIQAFGRLFGTFLAESLLENFVHLRGAKGE